MGEFLRKNVSRRLQTLGGGEIAALTTSMRQIGVGTSGGAEAVAIFHQLLFDEWMTGSLMEPLARIKVDEKNFFYMKEWKAVRDSASRFLPKYTAAARKHRNLSHVEQEGLPPMPKDRDAEQGDVDAPLECLALGMVVAETRGRVAARQASAAFHGLVLTTLRHAALARRPRSQIAGNRQLPLRRPGTVHRSR